MPLVLSPVNSGREEECACMAEAGVGRVASEKGYLAKSWV